MRDDIGHDRDAGSREPFPEPVWAPAPARIPADQAVKLFEGLPEQIQQLVLELIKTFVPQVLAGFYQQYHVLINTTVRQNVQAFSNERLAELAGIVNAEVNRRAGA